MQTLAPQTFNQAQQLPGTRGPWLFGCQVGHHRAALAWNPTTRPIGAAVDSALAEPGARGCGTVGSRFSFFFFLALEKRRDPCL